MLGVGSRMLENKAAIQEGIGTLLKIFQVESGSASDVKPATSPPHSSEMS